MSRELVLASGNVDFRLAGEADEAELRSTLRESPLPGWAMVNYEREPCYFTACRVEGPAAHVVVARCRDNGELIGFFTRSCRDVFINGERRRLGYLGQLRLTPPWQARSRAILRGFEACRRMLSDGRQDTPYYLTSILSDNRRARRMLQSGVADMPTYRPLSDYTTVIFSCRQRLNGRLPAGVTVERGSEAGLAEIAEFLQETGRRRCFHPVWTAQELARLRGVGLAPEDFFLLRKGDELRGCVGLWDQRVCKQWRVAGYAPWLSGMRSVVNLGLGAASYPTLPPRGSVLRQAFLSHVAVIGDDGESFTVLLTAAMEEARGRGLDTLATGFCAGHPLLVALCRRLRVLVYRSRLYVVHWAEGAREAESLVGLPMHAEAACL